MKQKKCQKVEYFLKKIQLHEKIKKKYYKYYCFFLESSLKHL